MLNQQQIRQGDILLERVDRLPRNSQVLPTNEFRVDGEHTGHAHRMPATMVLGRVGNKAVLFAVVLKDAMLRHEEHRNLQIPSGVYRVIRQRQRDIASPRPVPVRD